MGSGVDPSIPQRYLELRGKVVRIEPQTHNDFANAMAQKYLGVEVFPWPLPEDESPVVIVEPEHTT